jgi:hypothetical protein
VRNETKILVALLGGVMFVTYKSPLGLEISSGLLRSWWVLPFTFALASLAIMSGALLVSQVRGRRIPAQILSRFYLAICPSLAIIGILSTLPLAGAPPAWVGFAAPGLLFCSAFVHHRSLDEIEIET